MYDTKLISSKLDDFFFKVSDLDTLSLLFFY